MSKDGGSFVSEGGDVKAISAGLDAHGNPEVFAIGSDNAAWVNDNGAGWVSWGGVRQGDQRVGRQHGLCHRQRQRRVDQPRRDRLDRPGRRLQGDQRRPRLCRATRRSTASAPATTPCTPATTGPAWSTGAATPRRSAASVDNTVFAIGGDNAVYINRSGTSWTDLGGYAKAISAGVDTTGNPEVYAIGSNNAAYVSDNGSGFGDIGGYVTEISGTANGVLFARGEVVDSVYASNYGLAFNYVGTVPLTDPQSAAGYSPAPSGAPLYNSSGPSYLDVEQGVAADCWLMASLAEVAARDPQDIKNMFTYDGTTVDNGATVGLLHGPILQAQRDRIRRPGGHGPPLGRRVLRPR